MKRSKISFALSLIAIVMGLALLIDAYNDSGPASRRIKLESPSFEERESTDGRVQNISDIIKIPKSGDLIERHNQTETFFKQLRSPVGLILIMLGIMGLVRNRKRPFVHRYRRTVFEP